jgi:hypothetical protein
MTANPASSPPVATAERVGRSSGQTESATAKITAHQMPIATGLRLVSA